MGNLALQNQSLRWICGSESLRNLTRFCESLVFHSLACELSQINSWTDRPDTAADTRKSTGLFLANKSAFPSHKIDELVERNSNVTAVGSQFTSSKKSTPNNLYYIIWCCLVYVIDSSGIGLQSWQMNQNLGCLSQFLGFNMIKIIIFSNKLLNYFQHRMRFTFFLKYLTKIRSKNLIPFSTYKVCYCSNYSIKDQ